jgi:hypothetical protein
VSKKYQNDSRRSEAAAPESGIAMPDSVQTAMAEIASSMKEGLLALAASAGMQVMTAMMEESVTGCAARAASTIPNVPQYNGSEAGRWCWAAARSRCAGRGSRAVRWGGWHAPISCPGSCATLTRAGYAAGVAGPAR